MEQTMNFYSKHKSLFLQQMFIESDKSFYFGKKAVFSRDYIEHAESLKMFLKAFLFTKAKNLVSRIFKLTNAYIR